jgi:hypothetical protein
MDLKQAINLWTNSVIIEIPEINRIHSVCMVTFLQQRLRQPPQIRALSG